MIVRETASPDYPRPDLNVGKLKPPVTLPTTKARQGENRGHMGLVLMAGTGLAILALAVAYFSLV